MKSILHTFFQSPAPKPEPLPALEKDEHRGQPPVTPLPAFAGDIAAIAIENIFQLFDLAGLSGKLEVCSPANCGDFYFRKGVLLHGLLQINHRKVGQILLDSQVITETQLQECLMLHEQGNPPRRFGQILLEQGYVKPDSLDTTLLRQVKEAFFETLSWNEGVFRFYPDLAPEPDAVKLYARVDHLLLEGMVHIDQTAADQEE